MARESELKHDTCAASRFLKLCFGFIVDVIVVETAAKEKRGMGDCVVLPRMRTGSKVGGSLHLGGSSRAIRVKAWAWSMWRRIYMAFAHSHVVCFALCACEE